MTRGDRLREQFAAAQPGDAEWRVTPQVKQSKHESFRWKQSAIVRFTFHFFQ